MENQHPEEELTVEQLAERKKQMLEFYLDSIEYLEAQLKHETLLAEINEQRYKKTQYQIQYAMLLQGPPQDESEMEEEEEQQPKERKLRKQ
jgi:hypothetical protein